MRVSAFAIVISPLALPCLEDDGGKYFGEAAEQHGQDFCRYTFHSRHEGQKQQDLQAAFEDPERPSDHLH
jgi:hypothetical protein